MTKSLLRTDKEIAEIYKRHMKMVYRVCFAYMKNASETEDAVQDTFYNVFGNTKMQLLAIKNTITGTNPNYCFINEFVIR